MDPIAVLLPASDAAATEVCEEYAGEYAACEGHGLLFPVLYDLSGFLGGAELTLSMRAPAKSQYCVVRARPADHGVYDALCHALRRNGYYPAFRHIGACKGPRANSWYRPDHGDLYPKRAQPCCRSELGHGAGFRWGSSPAPLDSACPAVAKDGERVLRDGDGEVVVFEKPLTTDDVDFAVMRFSGADLSAYSGWAARAPMWFEQWVPVARHGGVPVEWRAFHYLGRAFYLCPKHPTPDGLRLPEPPSGILQTLRLCNHGFKYADFALSESGQWKVLDEGEGECARVPEGGSAEEFYRRLAEEIERGPYMPEWTWCLAGDIVDSHAYGEDKKTVRGTRHFAPGAKVYFLDAYWGQGGERCTVLGVPKYCDHVVGVTMETELIENFRLEKVHDKAVVKAIWTNRLEEDFERDRRTWVTSPWGNTEEDRREIQRCADMLNARQVRTPEDGGAG